MVDLDAALFHHFLEPSKADWMGHIPADAPQNHLTFKMATPELDHRAVSLDPSLAIIPRVSVTQNLRQNPRNLLNAAPGIKRTDRWSPLCPCLGDKFSKEESMSTLVGQTVAFLVSLAAFAFLLNGCLWLMLE
jgi:hypothetical protein